MYAVHPTLVIVAEIANPVQARNFKEAALLLRQLL